MFKKKYIQLFYSKPNRSDNLAGHNCQQYEIPRRQGLMSGCKWDRKLAVTCCRGMWEGWWGLSRWSTCFLSVCRFGGEAGEFLFDWFSHIMILGCFIRSYLLVGTMTCCANTITLIASRRLRAALLMIRTTLKRQRKRWCICLKLIKNLKIQCV